MSQDFSQRKNWLTKYGVLLALVFAASFLALMRLGDWAFIDSDEATYANVLRESLARGEHSAFSVQQQPWFEKPPLHFWAMQLSARLFGGLTEFSLRLPGALAYVAAIALTWLIAWRHTRDRATAAMAGAVLLTTGLFAYHGRLVGMDMAVVAATLAGFACFLLGLEKRRWLVGVGTAAGVAVLIKSVIGFLVYPLIAVYALCTGRWAWLRDRWFWIGNAIGFALAAPWHVYMSLRFGKPFWDTYFFLHVLQRTGTALHNMPMPDAGRDLHDLFAGATPWLLTFLVLACAAAVRRMSGVRREPNAAPFFALGFFVLVLFFVPRSRLVSYFLPAFPFIAIAIAMEYRQFLRSAPRRAGAVALLLLGFAATATYQRVFTTTLRDAYLQPTAQASENLVANKQRELGLAWKEVRKPLVVYNWPMFLGHTISFYADAVNVGIYKVSGGMFTPESVAAAAFGKQGSFVLLVPSALPSVVQGLPTAVVYQDVSFTLYEVGAAPDASLESQH